MYVVIIIVEGWCQVELIIVVQFLYTRIFQLITYTQFLKFSVLTSALIPGNLLAALTNNIVNIYD